MKEIPNELIGEILSVSNAVETVTIRPHKNQEEKQGAVGNKGESHQAFHLPNDQEENLKSIASQLLNRQFLNKAIPIQHIISKLRSLAISAKRNEVKIDAGTLSNLIKEANASIAPRTAIYPLDGIDFENVIVEIGLCTFRSMSSELKSEIESELVAIGEDSFKPSPDRIKEIINSFNYSVAIITVNSDTTTIVDRSLPEVKHSINCFLFLLRPIAKSPSLMYLKVLSTESKFAAHTLVLNNKDEGYGYHSWSSKNKIKMTLKPSIARVLRGSLFENLDNVLKKEPLNRTKWEKAILFALDWYQRGLDSSESKEALLSYVIVLEILVGPPDGYPIATYISENISLIIEPNPLKRIELSKNIKRVYNHRSKIVHRGQTDIPEDVLELAEDVAFRILAFCIALLESHTDKEKVFELLRELRLQREVTPC